MKKSKIVYNPLLSVAENATNNGVFEAAGIDRKRDNAIVTKRAIDELIKSTRLYP